MFGENEEPEIEAEKAVEEEIEEEAGEILIDQLKLLLDVTKLWHKVLRGEASIEELKSLTTVKPAKRVVEVETETRTTKRRARTAKAKSKAKPKKPGKKKSK